LNKNLDIQKPKPQLPTLVSSNLCHLLLFIIIVPANKI
jgi:hypothetical protein